MSKYCPSCGEQNHDVLENCWQCGTWIGRGRVEQLGSRDGASQVAQDFQIEKYDNLAPSKAGELVKSKGLSLITLYGLTKANTQELMQKHGIEYELADLPRICQSDDAMTEMEERQQMLMKSDKKAVPRTNGGGYYYHDDYTTGFCCYYACAPSPGYRSHHRRSGSACGGTNDCDCNDSGSDSDDLGALVVIVFIVLIIIALIAFAPTIIGAGFVVLELFSAVLIFIFNIITFGIFRKKLSRTRVRIIQGEKKQLDSLFRDIFDKRALPRIHGYWSSGFSLIRYGSQFFMSGLLTLALVVYFALTTSDFDKRIYILPGSIIIISIFSFLLGYLLINQKISSIQSKYLN